MDVKSSKIKVVKDLLAFKASCEGFPGLNLNNSLPSLTNALDAIAFLLDLIKSVVGVEALKEKLIDILSYELEGFELAIKKILKSLIKEVFSCNISPTIPIDMVNNGINIDISRIDFFNLLKVDPTSVEGSIMYGDPNTDFNYFLYDTIQLGTPNTWKNMLIVTYLPNGGVVDNEFKNNVINIKIDPSYTNKSIFKFLNNFIDTMRFLPETNTTPRIIDTVFGTVSSSLGKDYFTLKQESEFEQIMNMILYKYEDSEVEIDDTFLEFSNEEMYEIEQRTSLLQNGTVVLKECEFAVSSVNLSTVTELLNSLSGVTVGGERKKILTKQLQKLSDESTQNVSDENKKTGELAFFLNLIKGLIMVILKSIAGPAMILILSIYLKLSYGFLNFNDMKEFIKNNIKFYMDMVKKVIIDTIQKTLLTFLFNALKEVIICNLVNNTKQMQKQYQDTLNGLTNKNQAAVLDLTFKLTSLGVI